MVERGTWVLGENVRVIILSQSFWLLSPLHGKHSQPLSFKVSLFCQKGINSPFVSDPESMLLLQNISQSKCPSRGKKYCWLRKDDLPCWQLIKTASLAFSHSGTYNRHHGLQIQSKTSQASHLLSWTTRFPSNDPLIPNSLPTSVLQHKFSSDLFSPCFLLYILFHSIFCSISHFPNKTLVLCLYYTCSN